jgi:hypothetical protein
VEGLKVELPPYQFHSTKITMKNQDTYMAARRAEGCDHPHDGIHYCWKCTPKNDTAQTLWGVATFILLVCIVMVARSVFGLL